MKTTKGVSILTKPRGRPTKTSMELKQLRQLQKKFEEEKNKFEEEKKRLEEEKKRLDEDRKREPDERQRENNKKRQEQKQLEEDNKRGEEKKREEAKRREEEKKGEEEKKREEEKRREEEKKGEEEKKQEERNKGNKEKKHENTRYGDNRRDRDDRRSGHDNRGRSRNRNREYSEERRFRHPYSPDVERRDSRYTSRSPCRFRSTSRNGVQHQPHNNEEVQMLRSKIRELEHIVAENKLRELKYLELQQSTTCSAPTNSNEDEISKLKNRIRHYQQNNSDLKKKLDYSNKKLTQIQPGWQPSFAPSHKPPTNFPQEYNPTDYFYNNYY